MTSALINKEMLIYEIDPEDEDKENTEHLSTTSNSEDHKIPKPSISPELTNPL